MRGWLALNECYPVEGRGPAFGVLRGQKGSWIPAFAGMTAVFVVERGVR